MKSNCHRQQNAFLLNMEMKYLYKKMDKEYKIKKKCINQEEKKIAEKLKSDFQ